MINNSEFLIGKVPNFHPIADKYESREYWREQKRRCIEGYWVGGKWMPPELYYYVNFHNIKYETDEGVSTAVGLPWLRDIEWEKAYLYTEACGFSGFEKDTKYTCDRRYGPEKDLYLKLGWITQQEINTKEYMDVREYLARSFTEDMGKPVYRNSAKNVMDLEGRGGGKSYWGSGCIAHNFLFDGARDYNLYLERKRNKEPFVSDTVVGAIDAKYSNDLLDKVRLGIESLPGKTSIVSITGEEENYDSPLYVRYTGSLAPGKKWINRQGSVLNHRTFQDNPLAANGTRPNRVFLEEIGFFSNIIESWGAIEATQAAAEHKRLVIYGLGTGGLTSAGAALYTQEIFFHPESYNCVAFPDRWEDRGRNRKIGYFLPATRTRNAFKEGPNKITNEAKAEEIIKQDIEKAKNSGSRTTYLAKVINNPLTPSDIFLRAEGVFFPIHDLKNVLADLESNQLLLDASYKVDLRLEDGKPKMYPSDLSPIQEYPLTRGSLMDACIEIFEKPKYNNNGVIDTDRFIISCDPVDDDGNEDTARSLQSSFVLDTYTDRIVGEYTARTYLAETYYENVRKLGLFYNARILYEAHPYSQKVRLPDGTSKLWKNIEIGDTLFGSNNSTTKVVDIPVHENIPVYKITLRDGREIQASDSHIWRIYKLNSPAKTRLLTTKQMIDYGVKNIHGQHNFFIPNGGAVNYDDTNVPIDPYTMGLIIAEGSIRGSHCNKNYVQVSAGVEDANFYKSKIPYDLKYIGNTGYSYHLYMSNCKNIFENLGLLGSRSKTKFIPKEYLFNSFEKRLELLKGLMDGDGHSGKKGASIYVTTSELLKNDVLLLCRSMGINCSYKRKERREGWSSIYRINIYTDINIFSLPRKSNCKYVYSSKAKGSKASSYIDKTAISNIEFSHYEMGKCITVDNKDGLYLIDDYVLTHNCNKKGMYGHFKNKNALWMLAETPQILKDQELIKAVGIGNRALGVNVNDRVKLWGIQLALKYLEKESYANPDKKNLSTIRSIGLLKELIAYSLDVNADRVSALIVLMIFREELGERITEKVKNNTKTIANDSFWKRAYGNFNSHKVYNMDKIRQLKEYTN